MNEAIHTNCSRQHRFTGPQCHSPSSSDRQGHQLTSDARGLTGAHHVAETKKTSKYVGHNYTTPDLVAKVTGKAKYAEDYRHAVREVAAEPDAACASCTREISVARSAAA